MCVGGDGGEGWEVISEAVTGEDKEDAERRGGSLKLTLKLNELASDGQRRVSSRVYRIKREVSMSLHRCVGTCMSEIERGSAPEMADRGGRKKGSLARGRTFTELLELDVVHGERGEGL